MELTNEFSVGVPVDKAWTVLTDLERIAPCIPGAELKEVEGEQFRGVVRVKVGPVTARFEGAASIQERDEASHRAVVHFEGRDTRGQGTASGTVTATLERANGGTHVSVHTDLKISGKVAQFGRGVLADVSKRLLRQFVEALELDVLAAGAGAQSAPGEAAARGELRAAPESRRIEASAERPVDLLAAAGPVMIKRIFPVVLAIAVLVWLLWRG